MTADAAKAPVSLFAWIGKSPLAEVIELADSQRWIRDFKIDTVSIALTDVWEVNSEETIAVLFRNLNC